MRIPPRILTPLFSRVDAASLGVFRIVFGAVMLLEIWRYWSNGWIRSHYVVPKFFFHYPLFEWVRPLSGDLLYVHFAVLAIAALCITLGFFTRAAATVFAIGFSWWFLSDQTRYLNHFYLIALVSFLLGVVPTDRAFSLAARFWPREHDQTAPAWAVWLLRFQIGVPYVFGGLAKLNPDWLAGEPMRMWLAERRDFPILGPALTQEWCVSMFVWGGIFLDLLIVPALSWKRARLAAYAVSVVFHGTNAIIFSIGIFPWLMIGATTIFFEPDWPRRLWFLKRTRKPARLREEAATLTPARRAGLAILAVWVAFQCLFPLRHHLYPGNVSWTEEGHLFSWRMKLRDKSGTAQFSAFDPTTGRSWDIHPRNYLTQKQTREMIEHPELLVQFARHVAREHERKGNDRPQIRARVQLALNGRRRQLFIDPEVDLAAQPKTIGHREWILPLTTPLVRPEGRAS